LDGRVPPFWIPAVTGAAWYRFHKACSLKCECFVVAGPRIARHDILQGYAGGGNHENMDS